MTLPPLPSVEPYGYTSFKRWAEDYAASCRAEALEEAANLVELEYANDHAGVLRLKQIAKHIRDLKNA